LTEENFEVVIGRIRGKSYRDVERVAAEYRPPLAFRDRVRPVRVAATTAHDVDETLFDRECAKTSPLAFSHRPTTESKVFVQFLADEEIMELFEEVRTLLSRDGEHLSIAEVLKSVLAEYRERHSPAARQQRRQARKGQAAPDSQRWECGTTGERTRYIQPEVRDQVFVGDEGQCAYVAPDGTRCGSRHGLQVDHVRPFAIGGSNELSNLRLLCAAHNRRAARRLLGIDMRRYYPRE
jgi:5-methylcytosine-specific restriction endonuclease McrA